MSTQSLNLRKTFQDKVDYIDWFYLSANTNEYAIDILEQSIDKIVWYGIG